MNMIQKAALFLLFAAHSAGAATFTVINTLSGGAGSLSNAIAQANATGGTNTIAFNIPGAGVHTITVAPSLPDIHSPVIIDGYTQPGASSNTLATGDNANILIRIDQGVASSIFRVCDPTTCGGVGASDNSIIRGLCLVESSTGGTMLFIGATNILLTGNFIGVDTDGATPAGISTPVQVSSAAGGVTIGGTSPAARNVIASSNNAFALILSDADNLTVQGNYLGVNAAGTAALGACTLGIDIEQGSGGIIGGSAPGAGNVVNAKGGTGIQVAQACACLLSGTVVQGNLIGTDATGTTALRTMTYGIQIGASTNTMIGGSTPGAGNVIAGAGDGILIGGNPTLRVVIKGNKIGTDITGTKPLGNSACGIEGPGAGGTTSGTIGGTNAGDGNIIAYNGLNAFSLGLFGTHTWTILGNSIHDNGRLGITFAGCGGTTPTANDPCDSDTGPNGKQNYPVITAVSVNGGIVTLAGTLNSVANSKYRLEFFSNPTCDPSGFGQGQVFLGFTNITTDAGCNAGFSNTFPNVGGFSFFSATATDTNGNTSEFSPCAAGPELTIQPMPPNAVLLLWPTNASGFSLQFNTNLARTNWQIASPAPVVIGTNNVVTNFTTNAQEFYRLK